jgi:hypothetical protein
MLDPKVKFGTSTPMADPSGDYAFDAGQSGNPSGRPIGSRQKIAERIIAKRGRRLAAAWPRCA